MKRALNNFLTLTCIGYFALLSACGGGESENPVSGNNNSAPLADAGIDQNLVAGTQVTLNGSSSRDPDGDELTYDWTLNSKPAGSAAVLNAIDIEQPTFVADVKGTYAVSLVVNDGNAYSTPDSVVVTASGTNSAPVARTGDDQTVKTSTQVLLNGSGSSDPDGDELTYTWTLNSWPAGSTAIISASSSVQATLVCDVEGNYTISLVVNDGSANSAPDSIVVTASNVNSAPVADAGTDLNVITGAQVALNGDSSSDPDGDTLTYAWTLDSIPSASSATLSNETSVQASFVADLDGTYTASLVVNDGNINSSPDSITITATTTSTTIPPRIPSLLTIKQIHSGHSLTDSAMFQGRWPGHSRAIWGDVDNTNNYSDLIGKSTTPGSALKWRWDNPVEYGQPDARLDIANWKLLIITERVPFSLSQGTDPGSWYWDAKEYMQFFTENAWNNGDNGNGATTLLYATWTNLDTPDAASWRVDLDTYQPLWEQYADYGSENLPAGAMVYIIPGNLLMKRLYDDIEIGGIIPGISSINDFFQDSIHLNGLGNYALALLHLAVIHHVNPNTLPDPNYGLTPEPTAAQADYIKGIVWEVATNYERSGVPSD